MIKTIEHGFKVSTLQDGINALIFESSKAKEFIDFAIRNEYKRIMLSSYHGSSTSSLKDLLPLNDYINGLIFSGEDISYKNLDQFKKLTFFSAYDNGVDIIDLNWFPNLVSLGCSITNRLIGLENCSGLMSISIGNFKPKTKNLIVLSNLCNLNNLNIFNTNIKDLSGIEKLKNLKELEIYIASSLETLDGIQFLNKNLTKIVIEKCKKIKDYDILGKVHSLKRLSVSDAGSIKSLAFIEELTNLDSLSFIGTTILDGNLSYCERLNFVGFENKKHYTHTSEQFK